MASFNLNFKKTRENINDFSKDIDKYRNTISMLHGTLINVDTTWNDANTQAFINSIRKDYRSFSTHIDTISKYVLLINNFCDNIQLVISRQFDTGKIDYLRYNSTTLNACILKLDRVYTLLNNTINLLDNVTIPMDFPYKRKIENYRSNFYNMRESISLLKKRLSRINSDIVTVINDYKLRINKLDFVNIDKKKMNYRWKTQSVRLQKNIEKDLQSSSTIQNVQFNNEAVRSAYASANVSPLHVREQSATIEMLDVEDPYVASVTQKDIQPEFLDIEDENFILDGIRDLSLKNNDDFVSSQGLDVAVDMHENVSNPTENLKLKTDIGGYEIPEEKISNSKQNDIELLE